MTKEEIEGDDSISQIPSPGPESDDPAAPKDVTDQYKQPSEDEEQYSTLQTNETDMYEEYDVCHGNETFKVVCSKDSNSFQCKTCDSDHCEHVLEAQKYRSTL